MSDAKNAWERVLDPTTGEDGPVMRARLYATFEGSFEQFVAWMNETFKAPNGIKVTVALGEGPVQQEPAIQAFKTRAETIEGLLPKFPASLHPYLIDGKLDEASANEVLRFTKNADLKIGGIKYLREKTGLGLKEAKELFEGLMPRPASRF